MGSVTPNADRLSRGPTSGVHRAASVVAKPLLASEVLREELAPLRPAQGQSRLWYVVVAAALALLCVGMRLGAAAPTVTDDDTTLGFSAAAAVAAVALLPFPYAMRAGLTCLIGLTLMVLGVRGAGPLAGLNVDGAAVSGIPRLVVLVVLPAALLFRSHYRAYSRARHVLALALLASLPFLGQEVWLAMNGSAPIIARVVAGTSVALVTCGLFGFMGQSTTGLGNVWASLIWVVLSAEIGLRQLSPLADSDAGFLIYPATAVGLLCVSILAGFGLFQLLAAGLAPEARRLSMPGSPPSASPVA